MKAILRSGFLALAIMALAVPANAGSLDDLLYDHERLFYPKPLRLLRPLAEQGVAGAQVNLGLMYENGSGVPQDYAEAVKWYRLAADQNHPRAQFLLGNMYANGRGVPQDGAEAVKWYGKAAEQGDAFALTNLGIMYATGNGVPQDDVLAHLWFNVAAASGNEVAQKNRDFVSSTMTPDQIAEAQRLAREWLAKHQQ
jgi:TPR repeat protein